MDIAKEILIIGGPQKSPLAPLYKREVGGISGNAYY
jgi:hypothetical protein